MKSPNESRILTVGLVGNPNCGKTTLFNALTGFQLKNCQLAGRDSGEGVRLASFEGIQIHLIDLPGIYSLDCSSAEEREAWKWLQAGGQT